MIPVSLTIKGLYSYREQQTIDFSRLLEGQLFGIFGGVGSGKSSILEAISFALYDQTERLNQKDKRNYNMMNLKSDELLIDFTFKAGKEETLYRFKVSATRKKKSDEVNPFQRNTYRFENSEWLAQELNAEEIIGLSYDNFKRTIIIPQGKFQEFLQLTDGQRIGMMKEIFRLERFDLLDKVNSLLSKSKLHLEHLDGQLLGLQEVNQEKLDALAGMEQGYQKSITEQELRLQKKEKEEQLLSRARDVVKRLREAEQEMGNLKLLSPEFAEREQKLDRFERWHRLFRSDLDRLSQLQQQEERSRLNLTGQKKILSGIQLDLQKKEKEFEGIKADYLQRDEWLKRAEELEKITIVHTLSEEIVELQQKYGRHKEEQEKQTLHLKELENKEQAGYKKLLETRGKRPDSRALTDVKSWFDKRRNLEEYRTRLQEHRIGLKEKLDRLKGEVVDCVRQHQNELPQLKGKSTLSDLFIEIRSCQEGFESELQKLNTEIEELRAHSKLEEFARELKPGDPCPLCGSVHHPSVISSEENHLKLQKTQQNRERLTVKLELLSHLHLQTNQWSADWKAQEPLLEEKEKELSILREDLEKHQAAFQWKEFDGKDETALEQAFQDAKELELLESKILEGLEKVKKWMREAKNRKEEEDKLLSLLQSQIAAKEGEKKLLEEQTGTVRRVFADLSAEKCREESGKLKKKAGDIEALFKTEENTLLEIRRNADRLRGTVLSQEDQLTDLKKELEQIGNVLQKRSLENGVEGLYAVNQLLAEKIDIEKERTEIANFNRNKSVLTEKIKTLREQTGEVDFDEEQFELLREEVRALKLQIDEQKDLKARIVQQVNDLKEDLKKRKLLEAQREKVSLRGENLKLLSNLFRGHGFVNFISSQYLVNLCNAANERFYKLTRQHLRLEVSENNDFVVRDFLNNGKLRSVKTLSGGQTFQASLCLALALADSIQQQNQASQNFFFLDEGFGSQDKESLRLVFDALKALRKEKRMVGLISHVEEMQQEIDVFLKVENHEETGSRISASWQ